MYVFAGRWLRCTLELEADSCQIHVDLETIANAETVFFAKYGSVRNRNAEDKIINAFNVGYITWIYFFKNAQMKEKT